MFFENLRKYGVVLPPSSKALSSAPEAPKRLESLTAVFSPSVQVKAFLEFVDFDFFFTMICFWVFLNKENELKRIKKTNVCRPLLPEEVLDFKPQSARG